MKVIWNFIKGILVTLWVFVAIFSTICLLATNDYMVSEFGDYSLFVVDNRALEPTFNKNDIVITYKDLESKYKVGDTLFFYYGNKDIVSFINMGKVTKIDVVDRGEDNFYFDDLSISYGNLIGGANGTIVIHRLGFLLSLLESKWGFMFLVILPTIYAIVYEIYTFVLIVKEDTKKELAKESN